MDSDDQQNRLHLNDAGTDDQQNRLLVHSNHRQNAGNQSVCHIGGGDSVNDTTERHHNSESTNHAFLFRNFHEHSNTRSRFTPSIAHFRGGSAQHIATSH